MDRGLQALNGQNKLTLWADVQTAAPKAALGMALNYLKEQYKLS